MSKPVRSTTRIPATVEAVVALRTSERWVAMKASQLHDGSVLVRRVERPDGGIDLAVSRELPSGVPGFLERFLPAEGKVVQHESWGPPDADGVCTGSWSVDLPGAPARLGGTSTLAPDGEGCLHTIVGTVSVSIPLVGGRAESFVAEMTEKLMAKEAELMVASLSA